MFGWFTKSKTPSTPDDKSPSAAPQNNSGPISKEDAMKQAMANVRVAREAIGPETLDKVLEIMQKKQKSAEFEKAREALRAMDVDKLTDNIKYVMHDDKDKTKK